MSTETIRLFKDKKLTIQDFVFKCPVEFTFKFRKEKKKEKKIIMRYPVQHKCHSWPVAHGDCVDIQRWDVCTHTAQEKGHQWLRLQRTLTKPALRLDKSFTHLIHQDQRPELCTGHNHLSLNCHLFTKFGTGKTELCPCHSVRLAACQQNTC